MYESNIGFHTSCKELLQKPDEYFKHHKTFQVFVGSPQSLEPGSVSDYAMLKQRHPDVEFIVHASYTTNLCKSPSDRITQSTLRYLILHTKQLASVGCRYLVVHTGARAEDVDIKQSMVYLYQNCQKYLLSTCDFPNLTLLLENDVGSKKSTRMGDMRVLSRVVRKIDSDRLGVCYDTEHGFGAGQDFSVIDSYNDIIRLVHLNSVPKDVEFGSHKDRHTSTTFYESQDVINTYIDYVLSNGYRAIMEIDPDLAPDNYRYLEEEYNGEYWRKAEG